MGVRSPRVATAVLCLAMVAACGAESDAGAVRPPAACADPINDPGHCAYELKDSDRRTRVPAIGQDEELDAAAAAVFNAARAGCSGACTEEAVRTALKNAGYTDAVVRIGRADDPTVPGALLWAVRVGDVCVLGDVVPGPDGRWHEWYAGLLPDGRCLTG